MSDDVVKMIYLARRNPAIEIDQFPERWRQHALLGTSIKSLPGLFTQVTQCLNLYDRSIVRRASLDHDGVNLLTLQDRGAIPMMWGNEEANDIMLPDELATFSSYVRHFTVQTREQLLCEGPMRALCLITFLKRDRRHERAAFLDALADILASAHVEGTRCVLNRVEDAPPGYDFDAISEQWFGSTEEAVATQRTEPHRHFMRCRAALCDEARSVEMMTRISHSWPAIASTPDISIR